MAISRSSRRVFNNMAKNHAGVWFPPPLMFALPLMAATAFNSARPWTISGHYPIELSIVGSLMIVSAIAIGVASVSRFWKANTTILPAGQPTTAIVDRGPYRFTRNPMYLAMAGVYLGLSLLLNNVWALLFLPLVLSAVDHFVIRREERYLAAKFGEAYLNYRSRVRRWI